VKNGCACSERKCPFFITTGNELPSGIEEMRKLERYRPEFERRDFICRMSSDHLFTQSDMDSFDGGAGCRCDENARL
jgi:hypothetical protein